MFEDFKPTLIPLNQELNIRGSNCQETNPEKKITPKKS